MVDLPVNVTEPVALLQWVNTSSDGLAGPLIVFVLSIIMFATLSKFGSTIALLVAGLFSFGVTISFVLMRVVGPEYLAIPLVMSAFAVIFIRGGE